MLDKNTEVGRRFAVRFPESVTTPVRSSAGSRLAATPTTSSRSRVSGECSMLAILFEAAPACEIVSSLPAAIERLNASYEISGVRSTSPGCSKTPSLVVRDTSHR